MGSFNAKVHDLRMTTVKDRRDNLIHVLKNVQTNKYYYIATDDEITESEFDADRFNRVKLELNKKQEVKVNTIRSCSITCTTKEGEQIELSEMIHTIK